MKVDPKYVTASSCSDAEVMLRAVNLATGAAQACMTAMVMLTSTCKQDGHGIHTSLAVINKTGEMSQREAEAIVRRLRTLADELEQRFCQGN